MGVNEMGANFFPFKRWPSLRRRPALFLRLKDGDSLSRMTVNN